MKILSGDGVLDALDFFYSTVGFRVSKKTVLPTTVQQGTLYGYSSGTSVIRVGEKEHKVEDNQFFCLVVHNEEVTIQPSRWTFAVFRLGYIGIPLIGGPIEQSGRLVYIDGCSDSHLVFPNRLGDPSLNSLYFPKKTIQSFHTHPTIRVGCVAKGSGIAELKGKRKSLKPGDVFLIDANETHRFLTKANEMVVIAFHPDGDWGPTDQQHSMINRTYLTDPTT